MIQEQLQVCFTTGLYKYNDGNEMLLKYQKL